MGKSKKAVLFYKKLETQELTVEEKEEKARKDKKLRELHQQALEDKFRQPGFIYRDQDVKNNRRYIESEGMINRRFMQHESAVYGCHVTMDQKYLVSYAADGIRLWDFHSTKLVFHQKNTTEAMITARGSLNPCQNHLIYCQGREMFQGSFQDDKVTIDRPAIEFAHGHDRIITFCAYSADGKLIATCSSDTTVIIWSGESFQLLCIFPAHAKGVSWCGFSPDGTQLLTAGGHLNSEMKLWDTSDWKENTSSFQVDRERRKYNQSLGATFTYQMTAETVRSGGPIPQFCNNNSYAFDRFLSFQLAVPLSESIHQFPNIKIPTESDEEEDEEDPTIDLTNMLDPSGNLDGSVEKATTIPMEPDKYLIRTFDKGNRVAHSGRIHGCAFSPTSSIVVSACADRDLKFWNSENGQFVSKIAKAHVDDITSCAYSPNGELLASGSTDTIVKIWKTDDNTLIFNLYYHCDSIHSVGFDFTGNFVLSCSGDHRIAMWCVVPTVPDQPKQPIVTNVECHSITIAWEEPLANGAKLLSYRILISEENQAFSRPILVSPKETTLRIENLHAGTPHRFTVAALNDQGSSEISDPTISVETLAFAPSKLVRSCDVSDATSDSVTLTWVPPRKNGARIRYYHIHCIPEDGGSDDPLLARLIKVKIGVDEIRKGMQKDLDLQAAKERKSQMIANRQRKRQEAKTKKKIKKTVRENPKIGDVDTVDGKLFYIVKCLQPGAVYQFKIAAENRCGIALLSQQSPYIRTDETAPDPPCQPVVFNIKCRQVDVRWEQPRANGSGIIQYTIKWNQQGLKGNCTVSKRELVQHVYTITNLEPGQDLQVSISAFNIVAGKLTESLDSELSSVVSTACDVPNVNEIPILFKSSAHTLTVSLPIPCCNGSDLLSYSITTFQKEKSYGIYNLHLISDETIEIQQMTTQDNRFVLHDIIHLHASSTYLVHYAATNSIGKSDYSNASDPMLTTEPTLPAVLHEAPTISDITTTSATLRWPHPIHDGGARILSYAILYSVNQSDFVNEIPFVMKNQVTLNILKPRHMYSFKIAPRNAVGLAGYSPTSDSIRTPSLAEFTIQTYFKSRPKEEHAAARRIQRFYRQAQIDHAEFLRYMGFLAHRIPNWQLL